MQTRIQTTRITTTFLCALALGMWIGAGWHASVHQLADFAEDQTHACCCRDTNQTGRIENLDEHNCPICQIGTSAPDVQSPPVFVTIPEFAAPSASAWTVKCIARLPIIGLPLQRGPPQFS